jgi:hypothetical protein
MKESIDNGWKHPFAKLIADAEEAVKVSESFIVEKCELAEPTVKFDFVL